MAYQSLYRKYRPQRFGELVGQTHVTTALRNAVRDARVGHAYLFSGPRGTGKTTTARLLAKALSCTNLGPDGDPCGACEACLSIADGSSLDVIEVDAASRSKVDEMRDLLERVSYLSAGGGKKVYILDEVHMLSASAEAALLKTLEESPEHVVFVLATTDPLKVAPTIRSRTQHFEFTLSTAEEIEAHLADVAAREGVAAEPAALALIARAAAGSMRDSLSLLDQAIAHGALDVDHVGALLGGTPTALRVGLLTAVAEEDVAGALVALADLLEAGHEPRRLTEDLLTTCRDAFLLSAAKGRVRIEAPEEEQAALGALAETFGAGRLVRTLETLGEAIVDMRGADAADPRLVLEIALVRLARRDAGPPLQALADRVERLERAAATAPPVVTTGAGAAAPGAAAPAPAASTRPTLGALRRSRDASSPPATAVEEPEVVPLEIAPEDAAAPATPIELDDVVVAWAAILPGLPVATRSAVQEAQPLAVEGDVITFAIPPHVFEAAKPRFRKAADSIRDELSKHLGRKMRFDLKARRLESSTGDPSDGPGTTAPDDAEEVIDLDSLVDAPADEGPVDSVGIFAERFDAVVVEELPRD